MIYYDLNTLKKACHDDGGRRQPFEFGLMTARGGYKTLLFGNNMMCLMKGELYGTPGYYPHMEGPRVSAEPD